MTNWASYSIKLFSAWRDCPRKSVMSRNEESYWIIRARRLPHHSQFPSRSSVIWRRTRSR